MQSKTILSVLCLATGLFVQAAANAATTLPLPPVAPPPGAIAPPVVPPVPVPPPAAVPPGGVVCLALGCPPAALPAPLPRPPRPR